MKKTYILDTNILIQTDGEIIFSLDDNDVVITNTTLEELDHLKTAPGETGYSARESIRKIFSFRHSEGSYTGGYPVGNGGTFRIEMDHLDGSLPQGWSLDKPDNRIIAAARSMTDENPEGTFLITNDAAMRIKALANGIHAQGYHNDEVDVNKIYKGRIEVETDQATIDNLYELRDISTEDELVENEFVRFKADNHSALTYYKDKAYHLIDPKMTVFGGVRPKNEGQAFALHALTAPADEIPLVILKGEAGTGKTYLSLAAALDQTYDSASTRLYDQVIITRSNTLSDADIGFLPGTLEEKMTPLLAPFYDNVRELLRKGSKEDFAQIDMQVQDMMQTGVINICSLAYIRGRSIPRSFMIVDEVQNMSPIQVKSLVTRAGLVTKLVLLGDPDQIDTPKLSKRSNGLSYIAEKMAGNPLCMQLTFKDTESVRSPLATAAAKIL